MVFPRLDESILYRLQDNGFVVIRNRRIRTADPSEWGSSHPLLSATVFAPGGIEKVAPRWAENTEEVRWWPGDPRVTALLDGAVEWRFAAPEDLPRWSDEDLQRARERRDAALRGADLGDARSARKLREAEEEVALVERAVGGYAALCEKVAARPPRSIDERDDLICEFVRAVYDGTDIINARLLAYLTARRADAEISRRMVAA